VAEREPWPVALFSRSVLKQRKLREIETMLGPTEGLRCLDLGSDNGVISLFLRRAGGRWASADLAEEAVASIRELVKTDVTCIASPTLPYPDREFDRVVVVDMLEHVADDERFVAELARITRPQGRLIVNTPHLKDTLLRRVRHAIGQTDEKHGHLRPGYTEQRLRSLLEPAFALESAHSYSRFFSEAVDTAINWGVSRLGKKPSSKGLVVTGADVARHRKLFRAYSLVYPLVSTVSALDQVIPWTSGYMLIARAVRTNAPASPGPSPQQPPEDPRPGGTPAPDAVP
jgi:2-polyprenyl-3-methyl-5-hydroxy-6-metoxy-1,4-benzoquinol methylase